MFQVTCKGCQEYLSKPWFNKDAPDVPSDVHTPHASNGMHDAGMKHQDMIMAACKGPEKNHALVEKLLAEGHEPNAPEPDSGELRSRTQAPWLI